MALTVVRYLDMFIHSVRYPNHKDPRMHGSKCNCCKYFCSVDFEMLSEYIFTVLNFLFYSSNKHCHYLEGCSHSSTESFLKTRVGLCLVVCDLVSICVWANVSEHRLLTLTVCDKNNAQKINIIWE